jgi:hypothetical protein
MVALWFSWNIWVYYTGQRKQIEQLQIHLNNRDKTIFQFQEANDLLNKTIENQRLRNEDLRHSAELFEKECMRLNNILVTNKTGEKMAKKKTKTKTKKMYGK